MLLGDRVCSGESFLFVVGHVGLCLCRAGRSSLVMFVFIAHRRCAWYFVVTWTHLFVWGQPASYAVEPITGQYCALM